jgi:hypothetical protein
MYHITPKQITMALHSAIATSEPSEPSFMWWMSVLANVDTNIIYLLGQWHYEEMLWYLHVQAEPDMYHFASHMLLDGGISSYSSWSPTT